MFTHTLRGALAAAAALTISLPAGAQARAASAGTITPTASASVASATAVSDFAGVYIVMLERADGSMTDGRLIVERSASPSVMLATDGGIGAVVHVSVPDDQTLRGQVTTLDGEGTLTVHRVGDALSGTLVVGKQVWQLHGTRSV